MTVDTEKLRDRYYRNTINAVLDELTENTEILKEEMTLSFPQIKVIEDGSSIQRESHTLDEKSSSEDVVPSETATTQNTPRKTWRTFREQMEEIHHSSDNPVITATGKVIDPSERSVADTRKIYVPPKKLDAVAKMASKPTTPNTRKSQGLKEIPIKHLKTLIELTNVASESSDMILTINRARNASKIDVVGGAGKTGTSPRNLGKFIPEFFEENRRFPIIRELVYLDLEERGEISSCNHSNIELVRQAIKHDRDISLFYVPDAYCGYASKTQRLVISSDVEKAVHIIMNLSKGRTVDQRLIIALKYLAYYTLTDLGGIYPTNIETSKVVLKVLNAMKRIAAVKSLSEMAWEHYPDLEKRLLGKYSTTRFNLMPLVDCQILNENLISYNIRLLTFPEAIIVNE